MCLNQTVWCLESISGHFSFLNSFFFFCRDRVDHWNSIFACQRNNNVTLLTACCSTPLAFSFFHSISSLLSICLNTRQRGGTVTRGGAVDWKMDYSSYTRTDIAPPCWGCNDGCPTGFRCDVQIVAEAVFQGGKSSYPSL